MSLTTIFNLATPTAAAILLASGEVSGLNKHVSRKFIRWLLRCPHRAHRKRHHHKIVTSMKQAKKRFGWQSLTFENLLTHLSAKATKIIDAWKKIQNPLSELSLDKANRIALNTVLNCCNINRPVPFWVAIPFWKQAYAKKIAEGAYGEVYSTHNSTNDPRILKFVPVHGHHPKNPYRNVSFMQILPDVVCSKFLNELNDGKEFKATNFPILYSLNLIQGKFPNLLTNAWRNYNDKPEKYDESPSNLNPNLYTDEQFFIVIEVQDCGSPFSKPKVHDILACVSCVCQAASALAIAEKAFEFEHRDLHLGNILFQSTWKKSLEYILEGHHFEVITYGYQLFIIDFTMSRITVDGEIFKMEMDQKEYQPIHISEIEENFDWTDHLLLYRLSAGACNSDWSTFTPITNIYWLRYMVENLLRLLCEMRSTQISDEERGALLRLDSWREELMQCNSATMFLRDVLLNHCPLVQINRAAFGDHHTP